MPKVTVYKVKCFDVIRGEERILRSMATRSGARLLGAEFEIVEGSGLEIDESQLERRGELWTRPEFATWTSNRRLHQLFADGHDHEL